MVVIFNKRGIQHESQLSNIKLEQSRNLLSSTIEAQENERKRIGADIHDDVGPLLSLLKLQLNLVEIAKDRSSRSKRVADAKETIDSVINTIRRVSKDLAPSVLFELGLEDAILQMEEKLRSLSSASIHFSLRFDFELLSATQSLVVYRILQEGLNNILKHAKATQIFVSVLSEQDQIVLCIKDNGVGFDHQIANCGFGLMNTKARVEIFKGTLSIHSKPSKGTILDIRIPIDATANKNSNSR